MCFSVQYLCSAVCMHELHSFGALVSIVNTRLKNTLSSYVHSVYWILKQQLEMVCQGLVNGYELLLERVSPLEEGQEGNPPAVGCSSEIGNIWMFPGAG